MKKKNNIILSFDLDFTLINNRDGIADSFNYTLKKFNIKEKKPSEKKERKITLFPRNHILS